MAKKSKVPKLIILDENFGESGSTNEERGGNVIYGNVRFRFSNGLEMDVWADVDGSVHAVACSSGAELVLHAAFDEGFTLTAEKVK